MSLTDIIFGKSHISKPVILHKCSLNQSENFLGLDVSTITYIILDKLKSQNSKYNIQRSMVVVSEDGDLIAKIDALKIPEELSIISSNKTNKTNFLKYLVWLQMLDSQWNYYYYLPTSFVSEETGGQTLAVEKELNLRDITKIMIINSIIHEPISRRFTEQLRIREVEAKVNLLEQTYHDINRRYIPFIKKCTETNILADLLEDKISYLRLLAQGNREQIGSSIAIKEEIEKIFSSLSFEDKSKFQLDVTKLNSRLKLKGNRGAFISLFENLIGNTCRHALSRNISSVKIQIFSEDKGIYYKDNGQGFPKTIDDIGILQKIDLWFIGQFSENDMKQRGEGKNIRGMGLYIAKQSADFFHWTITPTITPIKSERVQIIFKFEGECIT